MNDEARQLIADARTERSPSELDRRRVRKAIALGLAAGASASAGLGAAGAAKAAGLSAGVKALVAVVVVASVGAGTYVWTRVRPQPPMPAVTAPPAVATPPSVVPIQPPEPVAEPATRPAPPVRLGHPAVVDPLVAELTLLQKAQRAWHDGQAAIALDLARRHAQMYPHSQLALERGALQVFALCALDRKEEAHRLATGLLAKAPRSPLRKSLEESCAVR